MNKDQVSGKWTEIKGDIQKAWGNLTDDELEKNKRRHEVNSRSYSTKIRKSSRKQ